MSTTENKEELATELRQMRKKHLYDKKMKDRKSNGK